MTFPDHSIASQILKALTEGLLLWFLLHGDLWNTRARPDETDGH